MVWENCLNIVLWSTKQTNNQRLRCIFILHTLVIHKTVIIVNYTSKTLFSWKDEIVGCILYFSFSISKIKIYWEPYLLYCLYQCSLEHDKEYNKTKYFILLFFHIRKILYLLHCIWNSFWGDCPMTLKFSKRKKRSYG